jgi:hypothetical protein
MHCAFDIGVSLLGEERDSPESPALFDSTGATAPRENVMFRSLFLSFAVVAMLAVAGTSTAEARGCYRGGYSGGYGGGYAPSYRSARYYGGSPSYRRGPSVYRSSHYGGYPTNYGGHHGHYHGGYRSGISLSFGF